MMGKQVSENPLRGVTDTLGMPLDGWYRAVFRRKRYYRWSETWSHDHCKFCFATFVDSGSDEPLPDTLNEGYAQAAHGKFPDDYVWVCTECFDRIHEKAHWTVIE
jgi:hypothetical protein